MQYFIPQMKTVSKDVVYNVFIVLIMYYNCDNMKVLNKLKCLIRYIGTIKLNWYWAELVITDVTVKTIELI